MPKPHTAPVTLEDMQALFAEMQENERRNLMARLVKEARLYAGHMSQKELAEALGVHENTIQNWESTKNPKGSPELHLREIEEATGKPPGWFNYQLDPYARVLEMAEGIDEIRKQLGALDRLVRRLL